VVTPIACSPAGQSQAVRLVAGTRAGSLYDVSEVVEEFWCNYGVNPDYVDALVSAGLTPSGFSSDGEIRIMELSRHPFFVATLFLPQKRSRPGEPHPLLAAFGKAVAGTL
jgi:CTP synthase (UTP-ammonia lyase)